MAKTVWGLDIGYSAVKAAHVTRKGSTAEVLDIDAADIEVSEDDSTRIDRVRAAVAEIVGRKDFSNTPVIVAVPGNQTFFREFSLPPVADNRVAEIVAYEARQQIPFPMEEVLWDYVHSSGEGGAEMGVSLIAIKRDFIDEIVAMLQELGLRVEGVAAAPLALFNYISHDIEPGETALVLDAGSKVTDFVVMDGRSFWFRPLPLSGDDFTRVLQQKFRMDFDQAEELKKNMGQSKQAEKIYQVLEPTMRNLTGEIQRTVGYYKSLSPNTQINAVYALGNAFRLPGLVKFITGSLGVDVTYLAGMTRIGLADDVDADNFAREFPALGVAIGVGLQGVGLAAIEMEGLLPESLRLGQLVSKKKPVAVVGVAAIVLAVALGFIGAKRSKENLEGSLGKYVEISGKVDQNKKAYDAATEGLPQLKAKVESWATSGEERGDIVAVLDKISRLEKGGKPMLGEDAGILVRQIYISRYDPRVSMTSFVILNDEEKEERSSIMKNFSGDMELAFKDIIKVRGGGGGRGAARSRDVSKNPTMCVLRGEILPKRRLGEDPLRPRMDLAKELSKALEEVPEFKNVKLGAGFTRLVKHRRKMDENGIVLMEEVSASESRVVTEEVRYILFQITWVYDPNGRAEPREKAAE